MSSRRGRGALLWILLIALFVGAAVGLRRAAPWMRVNRGIFEHRQHNHERAIEILSSTELRPPNFMPVQYLVKSHLELGHVQEAQEALRAVIEAYPDWAAPLCAQGFLLLRLGQWDAGWPIVTRAAHLSESSPENGLDEQTLQLAHATQALGEGRLSDALSLLAPVRSDPGETAEISALLEAMALFRMGRWSAAKAPLEESLELNPDNPRACVMMALVSAADGSWHEARMWFDTARSADPVLSTGLLVDALRHQIRQAEALNVMGDSVDSLSGDEALAWLSGLWIEAGRWNLALNLFESHPNPDLIVLPVVLRNWIDTLWALGYEEEIPALETRLTATNPAWNRDPNWPVIEGKGRRGWDEADWTRVDLLSGGDLPESVESHGGGPGWMSVHSNATFDLPVEVPEAGWYRVVLNIYATPSGPLWPVLEISVPPAPPLIHYINARAPYFHTAIVFMEEGVNTLRLTYPNDAVRLFPGEDRNLVLCDLWVGRQPLTQEIP
ncbi:tetratricopeptide repeat protein [Candidatus Sumerlaeota bacterium]|nr:tetratricopeptide repeat protein [Candidatus Sumerlaeota bacterium]